jgi:hypothetical protein
LPLIRRVVLCVMLPQLVALQTSLDAVRDTVCVQTCKGVRAARVARFMNRGARQ